MSEVMRKLGMTAITNRAVRGRIIALGLDTSSFPTFGLTDRARVFTEDRLRELVPRCTSYSQVARAFGQRPVGSTIAHLQRRVARYGLSTAHFVRTTTGRPPTNRLTPEQVLVVLPEGTQRQKTEILRRAMIDSGIPHKCAVCGNLGRWQGKPLVLDIDHRNGEWRDNRRENLRFLCPNCHTQTDTWRAMNHRRRRAAQSSSSEVAGSKPVEGARAVSVDSRGHLNGERSRDRSYDPASLIPARLSVGRCSTF
jgi:hypothetical protein